MPPEPHGRSGSRPPGRRERRTGEPTGAWVDSAAAPTTIGTPLTAIKVRGYRLSRPPPGGHIPAPARRQGWAAFAEEKGARPTLRVESRPGRVEAARIIRSKRVPASSRDQEKSRCSRSGHGPTSRDRE